MDPVSIARVCHEANRAIQQIQNDPGIPVAAPWDEFPSDEQTGVVNGVKSALKGERPARLHELWCEEKRAAGWTYGEVKDAEAKTHPCLRPYHELPEEQRVKDRLFVSIVRTLA